MVRAHDGGQGSGGTCRDLLSGLGVVDAAGEAAYARVWMGGCSRETTWACDSETLALEAFVIVVHHADVRRLAGIGEQSLEIRPGGGPWEGLEELP